MMAGMGMQAGGWQAPHAEQWGKEGFAHLESTLSREHLAQVLGPQAPTVCLGAGVHEYGYPGPTGRPSFAACPHTSLPVGPLVHTTWGDVRS